MSGAAPRRVRSPWFLLTGAAGGLAGFLLMEIVSLLAGERQGQGGEVLRQAFYFAGFGLAVGGALGMTEGLVRRDRERLRYGLLVGALLGAAGGFLGGAAGQTVYGLLPARHASQVDLAIVLDSSGSMKGWLFGGNDPRGLRRQAAIHVVDRLTEQDRVTVIDFDDAATVLFPLAFLDSRQVRAAARRAVEQVDDVGGTNLDAGLVAALQELGLNRLEGRPQHVIFLTDGGGYFDPRTAVQAAGLGIVVHTVALGGDTDAALLQSIAAQTGGLFQPVADAEKLVEVFAHIYEETLQMTSFEESLATGSVHPVRRTVQYLLRILGWALAGGLIGLGQGVRENTREDLRACGLGGLLGGALGGALFEPVSGAVALGAGFVGRALGDVVVGAAIGGSMRLLQQRMVEGSGRPPTALTAVLPRNSRLDAPLR